ncbi:MAG: hypothetical protein ACREJU_19145 [Nitrospiraceae bacterium]
MIRRILAGTLPILLFGLTFNASACLVPLYNAGQAPMGCESPPDQPVREHCDVFKTFSVEHADHDHPWLDIQTESLGETIPVTLVNTPARTSRVRFHDSLAPPVGEVLAKLTVLRL